MRVRDGYRGRLFTPVRTPNPSYREVRHRAGMNHNYHECEPNTNEHPNGAVNGVLAAMPIRPAYIELTYVTATLLEPQYG